MAHRGRLGTRRSIELALRRALGDALSALPPRLRGCCYYRRCSQGGQPARGAESSDPNANVGCGRDETRFRLQTRPPNCCCGGRTMCSTNLFRGALPPRKMKKASKGHETVIPREKMTRGETDVDGYRASSSCVLAAPLRIRLRCCCCGGAVAQVKRRCDHSSSGYDGSNRNADLHARS